jgi:hypothetical protein
MLSQGLQAIFTDVPLTAAGLLIFLGVHLSIVGRLFFAKSDSFKAESLLPFDSEEVSHE